MQNNLYRKIALCIASLSALALTSPAMAQRGGGGGGGQMSMPNMPGRGDLDQMRDMDQIRDRDRVPDQDRDRDQDMDKDQDRDRDQDMDRDRDRDRIHVDQVVTGQISAWSLLTDGESRQFRKQIRNAKTKEERNRIRERHQALVQQRARDLGIDAPFGPQGAGPGDRDGYYLAQMLTERERLQFHERMRIAANEQERERIRTEMHTMARERAREMGIDVPQWYGQRRGQQ